MVDQQSGERYCDEAIIKAWDDVAQTCIQDRLFRMWQQRLRPARNQQQQHFPKCAYGPGYALHGR